ncbi:MAG: hypothetical protein OXI02_07815 [Candidatus Dadabacteria bacterium]|nr:hypothetical protein [Candidatus Dadabacteria bacterium]MDE0477947.1 hypothetical protein [Candidatus Dadabacteria bacterium]
MLGGFIGVDFSGGKVRTVTVRRGLKGTETRKASSTGGLGESNTSAFFKDEISLGTRAVTGICSSPLLLRVLKFPFTDSKKLRGVFRFELENSTGFTLGEDVLSDYHEVRKPEGAEIIVPAFEKEAFEDYLGSLRESGVDPDQVTFTPVAFSSLGELIEGPRPLLLIDADQDHLNFSFFDESGLSRVRNCDDALERMKKSLAADDLDLEQINSDEEKRKGFLESCRFITEEIRNTIRYFEGETGEEVKNLVLTGGICEVDGVTKELTEQLGREVKRIFIEQLGHNDSPFFARAYALALYGGSSGKGGRLNLRRDGYRPRGMAGGLLKEFRVPVALCAALLLVFVFGRVTEVVSARSKMSSIRSEMEMDLRREFPQAAGTQDPVAFYRGKLEVINRKLDILKQVRGAHSPLEVLTAVSAAIPRDVSFSVDEIRIEDGGKAKIWGRSDSYEEIASIEKAFSESGSFTQVKMGQVGKAISSGLKFEISMVVR